MEHPAAGVLCERQKSAAGAQQRALRREHFGRTCRVSAVGKLQAGTYPSIAREGSPEFAMGVPVYVHGKPHAVICPVAGRLPALRRRLVSLVFFVASERERSRVAAQAAPGQRIEVLPVELPAASPPAVLPQRDRGGLTVRQAVNRMLGLDRM